jgi:CRISPR-associated endonuclease/helicase Cas3
LTRNNRRGLYNSPAILTASFVFDELHAYDDRMIAGVVALIKALPGAHFLLMTASLPKARKDFLLQHIGNIEQVPTPRKLEELPRYLFQRLASKEAAYTKAKDAARNKLKVLWICNTVGRAQSVFQRLQNEGLPVKAYHSRFKYEDRIDRHREVIDGFDHEKSPYGMIAVTTQVAEMSLDLDADILISEVAPMPALIQRLGRLNRYITPDNPGTPRAAYFLMPEGSVPLAPYHEKEFEQGQRWLDELINLNRPLSQADLVACFNAMATDEIPRLDLHTNWLDSGWFAEPESVREPSVTVSVILHQDESDCRKDVQLLIKKAIPMNLDPRRQMRTWKEYKGTLIAPPDTIDYDKERGARWI